MWRSIFGRITWLLCRLCVGANGSFCLFNKCNKANGSSRRHANISETKFMTIHRRQSNIIVFDRIQNVQSHQNRIFMNWWIDIRQAKMNKIIQNNNYRRNKCVAERSLRNDWKFVVGRSACILPADALACFSCWPVDRYCDRPCWCDRSRYTVQYLFSFSVSIHNFHVKNAWNGLVAVYDLWYYK